MIRVCCSEFHVGDRIFGEKEPLENKNETHGYCESCFAKEIEKVKKIKKEMEVKER